MVRIVVHLEVREELRVLKFLIVMRVFLHIYMVFFVIKYVLMIGDDLSDQTLV